MEKVIDFIFLDCKITADGDCSYEIKRCLLLGREAMANLDSILKSRDITLLTKVHPDKAMVFPIVIFGCESWTIKKAEPWRLDPFELWCWRRLLRVPWTARSNQSILKEIFIGTTDAEAEAPVLWPHNVKNWLIGKDPDAGKDWRQEEKGTTEDEMVGWRHRLKGHEFEQVLGVGGGQGSLVCCSPWSCKQLEITEELNWTAFISLFPNSLLLIWLMFCDKVPFSIFLCCLTNTRFLVGSMAKCHLKVLHPVFIPLKIAFIEVGFLPVLRESSITTSFSCMGYLGEASCIPWYLQEWEKDLNVFDLLWMYRNIWLWPST